MFLETALSFYPLIHSFFLLKSHLSLSRDPKKLLWLVPKIKEEWFLIARSIQLVFVVDVLMFLMLCDVGTFSIFYGCKLPKLKVPNFEGCQSWKWVYHFLLSCEVAKLPNCEIAKLPSCQVAKLPNCELAIMERNPFCSCFRVC